MEKSNHPEIEVLEGLEPIRRRPLVYIGDLSNKHITTTLLFQALCHAVDEAIDGHCTEVQIVIKKFGAVISYDAGLPLTPVRNGETPTAVILMSRLSGCSNMKKHIEVGSEYCELGLAVLNAVCVDFVALTHVNGQQAKFVFSKGKLDQPVRVSKSEHADYTRISFQLDNSILPRFCFDLDSVQNRAKQMSVKYGVKVDVFTNF